MVTKIIKMIWVILCNKWISSYFNLSSNLADLSHILYCDSCVFAMMWFVYYKIALNTRRCNHDPTHRVCARIGVPDTSFWKFTGQNSWCGSASEYNITKQTHSMVYTIIWLLRDLTLYRSRHYSNDICYSR